jgi:hypothetical protein
MIRKIIFLLVLFFLYFHLFSYQVRILKCQQMGPLDPGETIRLKDSPSAKKLHDEARKAIDFGKNCLPPKMRKDVTDFLNTRVYDIQLVCDTFFNCGEAWDPQWIKDIKFSAAAIAMEYNNGDCGCIESTLFHELIHLATLVGNEGHKEIYGCEQKCMATIANCIKYPPRGCATDCADFKKK